MSKETNEFTRYQVEFTASANHTKLEIDLGACGGEVYFDNVSLVEQGESTNLIANGDFETQGTDGWSASNNTMAQVEYELGEIQEPGILVSVGEAGWATFRTGSNVNISDPSVKAYVAKYEISTADAPEFLGFDGGITSINELNVKD